MIITLSLVNGFQETVSQKVFSFSGHIRVQAKQGQRASIAEELPIQRNDSVERAVKSHPDVVSVHPFATKYAILKTQDEIEGVLLKGFDTTYNFGHLKDFMVEGEFIEFNDSTYSRQIVMSKLTASQLKVKTGDKINIYFIRPDGSMRPDRLTITGLFKTGIEEYDRTFAIGDMKLIRRLNNWNEDDIGGYEVFLNDYSKMEKVSYDIYDLDIFPQLWDTKPIRELYPNIFDWLNMQNVTRDLLIIFMVIVAVINLITCLIILVLERIRMVGILKSLGATDWTVQKIFLWHSLIITISGIVLGVLFALGLLWLQQSTGFITLPEEAYYMSTASVKIVWWQVALVAGATLVVCFLVLLIPTVIVKRVLPVKAIQFR